MTATLSRKKTRNLKDLVLQFGAVEFQHPLSREMFMALAGQLPSLRMERDKNGITAIMPPDKRGAGKRKATLAMFLHLWNYTIKSGEIYGPSTGFDLPDGAFRQPDVAWISNARTGQADEEAFVNIAPDFVAEICSATDRLSKLQAKMTEVWMANGVRLAWLIDPYEEKVCIYRTGQEMETVEGFAGKSLSGEDVLPGFELPLDEMRRNV